MESTRNRMFDQAKLASTEGTHAETGRILPSKSFAISDELMNLLQSLITEALDGAEANTAPLGIALPGRRNSFDPDFDPTLRVQARRLRNRLRKYYQTAGIDDPIEIELPPQTYVPLIRWRKQQSNAAYCIGVRQFCSLSSDPEDHIFCKRLRQDLLEAMERGTSLRAVQIPVENGCAAFREICGELKLNAVLDSKLRKTASRLRLSVSLLNASDGSVIWTEMYDCPPDSTLLICKKVGYTIAQGLQRETERLRSFAPSLLWSNQWWRRLA